MFIYVRAFKKFALYIVHDLLFILVYDVAMSLLQIELPFSKIRV